MKNQKILKLLLLVATLIIAVFVFASCAASKDGMGMDEEMMYPEDSVLQDSGSSLPNHTEKGEMAEGNSDDTEGGTEFTPKIIKTATLDAETKDFNSAISEIEASVKALGGYIESCDIRNVNHSYSGETYSTHNANYVLRIPADRLDEFLSEAGETLNVVSSSSNAKDISGEYYDLQARVSVLETERELVSKMLSEAKDIDTMINLEQRLYDIIYEIESYKTAIKVYDSKVSYSTVTLSIREVADLTDLDADPSFGARVKRALSESWGNTVAFLEGLVIVIIYVAPALVFMGIALIATGAVGITAIGVGVAVIGAVAYLVFLIVRAIVKRAKRKAVRS